MHKSIAAILCLATLAPALGFAASSPGNFRIALNVVPPSSCLVAATNINFGNLQTVVGTETGTSTVSVRCPPGTLYLLSFNTVFSAAGLSRNSTLVSPAGNSINFRMSLGSFFGVGSGTHVITARLSPAPFPPPALYQSTQTINVIY